MPRVQVFCALEPNQEESRIVEGGGELNFDEDIHPKSEIREIKRNLRIVDGDLQPS